MQLQCKQCASDITSDNINIREAMALCSQCGAIFSFTGFDLAAHARNSRKVQQPPYIESAIENEVLHLSIPYYDGPQASPARQLLVIIILMLFALGFTMTGLLIPGAGMAWLLPVFIVFGLAILVVGTIDSKQCELECSPKALSVAVTPDSFEDVFFAREDIVDVFCEESLTGRESFGASDYNIFVRTTDRKEHLLIAKLPEAYARYTIQELQRHLQRGEDIDMLINEIEMALIFHDEAFMLYPEKSHKVEIFAEDVDALLVGCVDEPQSVELPDDYYDVLEKLTVVNDDLFVADLWDDFS